MKKIVIALMATLALSACGRPIDYNGRHYPTHGLLNTDDNKADNMCYELSVGNLFWSVVLFETVVAPIYFIGFSLFNPTGPKGANGKCGVNAN